MQRQLTYTIGHETNGKTIGTFLKEKGYSRSVLIALKKDEIGIRKNGTWAGVNEKLAVGDTLAICLTEEAPSENIVSVEGKLDILYEDEDLLVLNKPYDTPIHPSVNNYDNTLANRVVYYYEQKDTPHVFRCMNRLDRDTTGVTIIAKNLLSASILSHSIKERSIKRIYIALVEGITKEAGTIRLPIGRMPDTIIKRQVDEVSGKEAITHYQRLAVTEVAGKAVSVVAIQLETGRTHQIRVHMSAIGHPLLGDFLYNETNQMLTRQALHAAMCGFRHPITGTYKWLIAPMPKDMADLVGDTTIIYERLKVLQGEKATFSPQTVEESVDIY